MTGRFSIDPARLLKAFGIAHPDNGDRRLPSSTKFIVDYLEAIDEVARRDPRACITSVVAV